MVEREPKPAPDLKSGVIHLRSVTGLRFIAAFVVFVSHIQYLMFPESRLMPLGGPAVSFFFVLSGFILTYVYTNRLTTSGVPRFLIKRWARLWPLHVVCLVVALWFLRTPPGTEPGGNNSIPSLIAQFLMVHSWVPLKHWYLDFNSVSWSISTELFFYLCFPLLLPGGRRFLWKFVAVTVVAFGLLAGIQYLFNTGQAPAWVDASGVVIAFPLIRLFEFALGMATCKVMQFVNVQFVNDASSNPVKYVADSLWELFAVLLVIAVWIATMYSGITHGVHKSPHFGVQIATWIRVASGCLTYAFVILIFASRRGLLGQILGSRLGVWLGEISYAFYLIHQIVITQLSYKSLGDWPFAILGFLIALFAAALLYRIVEMPSRNALVAIYDRQAGWLSKWTIGWREIFATRMGFFQAVVLAGLLVLIWMRPVNEVNKTLSRQIIDKTQPHLRNVVFFEEAILRGVVAERVDRGVKIRMAWTRNRKWSRRRFLHICDDDGNLLAQGKHESDLFDMHKPNEFIVDETVVHKRKLKGAAYIAVGFWTQEKGCTKVMRENADMDGYRMKIVDLNVLE